MDGGVDGVINGGMDGWTNGCGFRGWQGNEWVKMVDKVNTNTHHCGAGHSSSVLARAELSEKETLAPPPGESWC